MPAFLYSGKTKLGVTRKGELEAPNLDTAVAIAKKFDLKNLKVKKKPKPIVIPGFAPKVTEKDLVVFTRQFATMIDAGLPLVQCLDILGTQQENSTFKEIILKIKEDVEAGSTFADALKKHPKAFDELYVNLVAAGEIGGILDTILNRLAEYIEKTMKLKKQVKGAMVYPTVVMIVAVVCIGGILIFVIPTFEQMFADFGGKLPGPTQLVVNISHGLRNNIWIILGTIAIIYFGSRTILRTTKGREVFDKYILKAPVFGPLLTKVAIARFTRTMGTMLGSGVPILDALDIVAKTAGNKTIEYAIIHVKNSISEGKTLVEPLMDSMIFPPMVTQMIGVGEQSGALETMLNKIADFYDDEVDAAVAALTSLIEPMLMVFLGGAIGGILIAMYLPIFSMGEAMVGGG